MFNQDQDPSLPKYKLNNEGQCNSEFEGSVFIVVTFCQFTEFVTPINQTIEKTNNNDNHNNQVFFNVLFIVRTI
ncbi:hypothetical protein IKO50_04455 [bacterium]|nr:hypothetical protein [bacterium]